MVAEPWDIGTYQVGNFPVDWSEWNGKFRDTMRSFGKGDAGTLADVGWRLTGSADLYGEDGRSAFNSINFITCHDGFTLNDLVSYNGKHNEKNGENNQRRHRRQPLVELRRRRRHERSRHPGACASS